MNSPQPQEAPPAQFSPLINPAAGQAGGDPTGGVAKPATSPEELEQRKAGWSEVLQNPNFMRALGFMGAHMMQPVQPGQTTAGHIGQAMSTGMNAFQLGEYSDQQQKMVQAKEARATAESGANVAATQAGTAKTIAATPGVAAQSAVEVATADARVAQAKADSEKTIAQAKKATTDADVAAAEGEIKKRRAQIEKEIPDEKIRAAALAEVDRSVVALDEARARLGLTKAQTGKEAAQTAEIGTKGQLEGLTLEAVKALPQEEQRQYLTKTGKYSQHTSGIGQQAQMWGDIYDKLPATDPSKKGNTREQFQMSKLESAKGQDALKLLTDYMKNTLDPDPEIVQIYTDAAKAAGAKRPGAAQTVGSPNVEKWVRDKSGKLVKVVEPPVTK